MVKNFENVTLGSANATKLAKFYQGKVGLKQSWDAVMGKDTNVYGFTIGKMDLVVIDHPKVKGKSKESFRAVFSLEVDNLEKEFAKLKKAGVKIILQVSPKSWRKRKRKSFMLNFSNRTKLIP